MHYNVLEHNCNNFTDFICKQILGKGIPHEIVDLPRKVLNTPFGKMILPQMNQMQQTLNKDGHTYFHEDQQNNNNNNSSNQIQQTPLVTISPIESSEEYEMIGPMLDDVYIEYTNNGKLDSFSVLNKIIKNIINFPNEPKYRTLKKNNKKLQEALYGNDTILTLMLMTGFEELEDS